MNPALKRGVLALLIMLGACVTLPLRGADETETHVTPYSLKVETRPGLLILTFQIRDGFVRVYLPDELSAGRPFSGSLDVPPAWSGGEFGSYSLEFAGQRAGIWQERFHWTAPATEGLTPLLLKDGHGNEVARYEVAIRADARPSVVKNADEFRVPDVVQSGSPIPVLGPFDGDSASTRFKLGACQAKVLAEIPGKTIVRCTDAAVGPVRYELSKGGVTSEGQTRNIAIHVSGIPKSDRSYRNDRPSTLRVRVSGLAGMEKAIEIRIESLTAALLGTSDMTSFGRAVAYISIDPKDVRRDGAYRTSASADATRPGAMEIVASVVIPLTPHDQVAQILRTPCKEYSTKPEYHGNAEALKPFGTQALPLLAEFLTDSQLDYPALHLMLLDADRAAPLVMAAIPEMRGQALDVALDTYRNGARDNPGFLYRRELHDAAVAVLAHDQKISGQENEEAILTLGVVGSDSDMPLLERIYQRNSNSTTGVALVRDVSEAALARLGVPAHIANIKARLRVEVKAPEDVAAFERLARMAAFTDNKEFVPYLCRHLGDPYWDFGDYALIPTVTAAQAIVTLEHKKDSPGIAADICRQQIK